MIDWKEKFQNLRESAPIQCGGPHDREAIAKLACDMSPELPLTLQSHDYADALSLLITGRLWAQLDSGCYVLLLNAKRGYELQALYDVVGKDFIVIAASGASLLVQLTKKK